MTSKKKRLLDHDVDIIQDFINLYPGYVTWRIIEDATPKILDGARRFSRVSLSKNDAIANAWAAKNERIKAGTDAFSAALPNKKDREAELRLHVQVLQSQYDAVCEQLARWAFNAERRGITQAELERQPPPSLRPARDDGEKRRRKLEERLQLRLKARRANRARIEEKRAARNVKKNGGASSAGTL
jgi:hypothetical protein